MEAQNKPFKSPVWAGRVLGGMGLLAFLLLLAAILPAWRQRLTLPLGIAFGLFWSLFGVFTFGFNWALPRRGGGFISPTHSRWLWLLICLGTVILGGTCVFVSIRRLIDG